MTPTQEILRARARSLAQTPVQQAPPGQMLDLIEFRLANESYAVERKYVREVQPLKDLTPLPCTPPFVLGIVNIRGQILPVINIKKFFDLPENGITDIHMIIVVHADRVEMGILADAVAGAATIPASSLVESLPTLNGVRGKYLRGVAGPQTVVLDVPSIINDPKITVNEEVEDLSSQAHGSAVGSHRKVGTL